MGLKIENFTDDYASLLDKELRQRHGELNRNSRHHEQARISPAPLIGSVRECWSSGGLILNGAKVQRKFLFAATASSEFFATDLVVIAVTNENVLGAFGDKLACET